MGARRCRARDLMTSPVVCVGVETNLRELEKILLEKEISGAPVVDAAGQLVGVISLKDLIHYHASHVESSTPESNFYRDAELERAFLSQGYQIQNYDVGLVGEMMTPVVHTAAPDTPAEDLARLMISKGIHRVIITRGNRVEGLVSAMDLLRVIAGTPVDGTLPRA